MVSLGMFDDATLAAVLFAIGIILAAFILALRSAAPRYRGLSRWAAANVLIGLGYFLASSLSDRGRCLGVLLPDYLVIGGVAVIGSGVGDFLERPKRWAALTIAPIAFALPLIAFFCFLKQDPLLRSAATSSILAAQFAVGAVSVLRAGPLKRRGGARFTGAVFSALSLWFIARLSLPHHEVSATLVVMIVGVIGWSFGLMQMTAMRLAEELAAREQEAEKARGARLVQTIIDTLPQCVVLKDIDSRYLACNAAFARTIGKTADEIVGFQDQDFYPPDLARKYAEDDRAVLAVRTTCEFVERVSRAGQDRWVETIKTPVLDPNGEALGVLVVFRDITERKLDEERLQESEARYRELSERLESRVEERTRELERTKRDIDLFFELTLEYLCLADFDGRFLKLSDSWTRQLGWRGEELVHHAFLDFVHREDKPATFRALRTLKSGGKIAESAARFKRADGSWIWLSWSAVGAPERGVVIAVAHDITARVSAEEQLRAAREEAERASRAKSQFISTISHELRTPLNAVLGYAGLLAPFIQEERPLRYIASIESSGRALLSIINDLLDLTRMESGRITLAPSPTDARKLLQEIAEIFRFGAEEKGLYLEFTATERLPRTILIDSARLRQVLINLIGNSIKFTDRGSVSLVFDAADSQSPDRNAMYETSVRIEVKDTGIGMTEAFKSHLFEPFSQQDGEIARRYGGTGLGLAIAKRLLDLMGADIRCESRPSRGTTFTIEIPRVKAADSAAESLSYVFDAAEEADALWKLKEKNRELEAQVERLHRLSMTDELTGIANRRSGMKRLIEEIARARRSRSPVCVLMGDLDRFKTVNDSAGHGAGDQVLAESADRFTLSLRESDVLCRWGGDEFMAVLPDSDSATAQSVAERVRNRMKETPIASAADVWTITISIGAACLIPNETDEPSSCATRLLKAADEALYRAKALGRDLVDGTAVADAQ